MQNQDNNIQLLMLTCSSYVLRSEMPGSPKFEPHFAEWGKDECGVQLLWAELRAGCCMRLHASTRLA